MHHYKKLWFHLVMTIFLDEQQNTRFGACNVTSFVPQQSNLDVGPRMIAKPCQFRQGNNILGTHWKGKAPFCSINKLSEIYK